MKTKEFTQIAVHNFNLLCNHGPHIFSLQSAPDVLFSCAAVLSVFDAGFSAKVGSSLCGQVHAGAGLIKAMRREGRKWFESADKLHSVQLK